MPTQGCRRSRGCRRRRCASDPADRSTVPIYASVPRFPDLRLSSPQFRSRHGHSACRGGLVGVLHLAAAGNYARGWDGELISTCPDLEIAWPDAADHRPSVGRGFPGVVYADLVLPAAEAGYRSSQLASFSCLWTLGLPAPRILVGMKF